jgi:hypothetical protein
MHPQGLRATTEAMQSALRAADAASAAAAPAPRRLAAAEEAAAARTRAAAAVEDAVALCVRHSAPADAVDTPPDDCDGDGHDGALDDPSHALWFALLDAALAPLRALRGGGVGSGGGGMASSERAALSASLERVLLSLRQHVPAGALVAKMVRDYGRDGLREMRGALSGTLRTAAADAALHAAAAAALAADAAAARADAAACSRRAFPAGCVMLNQPEVSSAVAAAASSAAPGSVPPRAVPATPPRSAAASAAAAAVAGPPRGATARRAASPQQQRLSKGLRMLASLGGEPKPVVR